MSPLVILFLTLSAIGRLLLQDKELKMPVSRYLATGAIGALVLLLLSFGSIIRYPLCVSAFIDLLLGCTIKS